MGTNFREGDGFQQPTPQPLALTEEELKLYGEITTLLSKLTTQGRKDILASMVRFESDMENPNYYTDGHQEPLPQPLRLTMADWRHQKRIHTLWYQIPSEKRKYVLAKIVQEQDDRDSSAIIPQVGE